MSDLLRPVRLFLWIFMGVSAIHLLPLAHHVRFFMSIFYTVTLGLLWYNSREVILGLMLLTLIRSWKDVGTWFHCFLSLYHPDDPVKINDCVACDGLAFVRTYVKLGPAEVITIIKCPECQCECQA